MWENQSPSMVKEDRIRKGEIAALGGLLQTSKRPQKPFKSINGLGTKGEGPLVETPMLWLKRRPIFSG